jgi:hypothetical protein
MEKVKHALKKGLEKVGKTDLGSKAFPIPPIPACFQKYGADSPPPARQEDRKAAYETAWTTSRDQHASMTGRLHPSLASATHIGHQTGLPSKDAMTPPSNKPKSF